MVFSMEEIRNRIAPIAKKYGLRAVFVFGSYARGEATADSDIDLLIDRTGSNIRGMLDMGNLYNELCASYGKEIDLITTHTLEQHSTKSRIPSFVENLQTERIRIYG